MKFEFADKNIVDIRRKFIDLLDNSSLEEQEKYYFKLYYYVKWIEDEIVKYSKINYKWNLSGYFNNLAHETNRLGGNIINSLRNYHWYLENDKKKIAMGTKDTMLNSWWLFILGIQSLEVLYSTIEITENKEKES